MIRSLPVLASQATLASSRLVNCKGCTSCCEKGGPVYIADSEVPRLRQLGVPLVRIDGVSFIQRLQDGACPMLDRLGRRCTIYETRPLCCRLFPLDVLSVDGRLQWAVANQCPEDRKLFAGIQNRTSGLGLGSLTFIASMLDGLLTENDLAYFRRKERVSARLELLDLVHTGWTFLKECSDPHLSAQIMAKKKETTKEKLKRMLKQQKERNKKKGEDRQKRKSANISKKR